MHAEVARANIANAGLAETVEVSGRPGARLLAQAGGRDLATASFDLTFIDADKPNNPAYFSLGAAADQAGRGHRRRQRRAGRPGGGRRRAMTRSWWAHAELFDGDGQ